LSEVKSAVAEQSREQRLVHAREAKEVTRRKLTGRRRSTTIAEIIPDNTPDDIPLAAG
jgi:hypothetical protein